MYITEVIFIRQLSLCVGFVCFGVVRWRLYIDPHSKHMFYNEYLNLLANEPSDLIWEYTNSLPFTMYDLRQKLNLKTANARCMFVASNIIYVIIFKKQILRLEHKYHIKIICVNLWKFPLLLISEALFQIFINPYFWKFTYLKLYFLDLL